MALPSGSDVPVVLCLHGRGTNALIFQFQARRITKFFAKTFRFVFVDAPFEQEAGVGVLPFFESCEPFRGWRDRERRLAVWEEERAEVWEALDAAVGGVKGGWKSVVGVMGFSEGAQLGYGLVLGQLVRAKARLTNGSEDGKWRTEAESSWSERLRLKFAVLVGSPTGPIYIDSGVKESDHELLRNFPTVFAWGQDDPWKEGWPSVEELKKEELWSAMEFDGDHHLPLTDPETAQLSELIKLAWEAGQERFDVMH